MYDMSKSLQRYLFRKDSTLSVETLRSNIQKYKTEVLGEKCTICEEPSQIAHTRVKDPKRGLRENRTGIQTEIPGLLWTIDITPMSLLF